MFRFYLMALLSGPIVLWTRWMHKIYKKHPNHFSEKRLYRMSCWVMNGMRMRALTWTKAYGTENLPEHGGYILYSNHQGKYDALGIFLKHKKTCRVLMEKKQSEKVLANEVVDFLQGQRLDFEDPRQQLMVLKAIGEEVKDGKRYLIFPEGGYTDNKNTLQEFHSGCFRPAYDAKCPIIPVCIVDSYKSMNSNTLEPVHTQVHYLAPIPYEEYKDLKKTELAELVKARIQAKMDEVLNARKTPKKGK